MLPDDIRKRKWGGEERSRVGYRITNTHSSAIQL